MDTEALTNLRVLACEAQGGHRFETFNQHARVCCDRCRLEHIEFVYNKAVEFFREL